MNAYNEELPVEFAIDRRTLTPKYQQIVEQVHDALLLGRLQSGDRLPTARDVALTGDISFTTVLKAYGMLEREKLVRKTSGVGTRVGGERAASMTTWSSTLGADLARWITAARRIGLTRTDIECMMHAWLSQEFGRQSIYPPAIPAPPSSIPSQRTGEPDNSTLATRLTGGRWPS